MNDAKVERLVLKERVRITERDEAGDGLFFVSGEVEGDTDTYIVEVAPDGTESCTCPANSIGHRHCTHLEALRLEVSGAAALMRAADRARQRMQRRSE